MGMHLLARARKFILLLLWPTVTLAAEQQPNLEELYEASKQQQQTIEQQQGHIEALQEAMVAQQEDKDAPSGFSWQGYGVINYQEFDFFTNAQDNDPERRATTDLERFVLIPTYDFNESIRLVAEIEFEHGGTGSAVEFEPEEAGEFEAEIEKGGEIILEQLNLVFDFRPALNFRVGEILIPFGMVNTHHQPTEYFTLQRSLAETSLIPSVWHEIGLELFGDFGQFNYQLQIIRALDSSRFSGPGFVAEGSQSSLETKFADDLALVGRLDYAVLRGLTLGTALYFGDSANNRARQNLDGSADVFIYEFHGRYQTGPITLRGQFMQGTIDNSDQVTRANLTTFNSSELGVSRTSVGHRAQAFFVEAGYDVLSFFPDISQRLDVFARYEEFDSHDGVEGNIVNVPRFDRQAKTFGINYKIHPAIVFKGEYSFREHSGDTGNKQDVWGLGLGFEF